MKTDKSILLARKVLNDCSWALARYSETLSGEPLRISWVSITTLLRAVGHVLSKVDSARDRVVAEIVTKEWDCLRASKPKPEIFWEFIESERNSVLKQYEFGFSRTFGWDPPLGQGGLAIYADLLSVTGGALPDQDLPNLHSKIIDGPFQGRSEKEVALEAVKWWDAYLTNIETLVARKNALRNAKA